MSDYAMTLQEIADHFGVTREAIRCTEARALSKIRNYLDDNPDLRAELESYYPRAPVSFDCFWSRILHRSPDRERRHWPAELDESGYPWCFWSSLPDHRLAVCLDKFKQSQDAGVNYGNRWKAPRIE